MKSSHSVSIFSELSHKKFSSEKKKAKFFSLLEASVKRRKHYERKNLDEFFIPVRSSSDKT